MLVKISKPFFQPFHVRFFDAVKTDAAMHLQSLCSGDYDSQFGLQATFAAFDIIEFLCSQICTEAGFCHYVVTKRHCHFSGKNRVTTMRYICERPTMHKCSRSFGGLHQVGMNGVFQ